MDPDTSAAGAKQPGQQNKQNEADASEADKKTIANIRKHESDEEKDNPQFRPSS